MDEEEDGETERRLKGGRWGKKECLRNRTKERLRDRVSTEER